MLLEQLQQDGRWQGKIRCFDGKHFDYWKLQITDMLYAKELEDAILEEKRKHR